MSRKTQIADTTLYVERSKVRGIVIGHNAATQAVLSQIDALPIFVASDFSTHRGDAQGAVEIEQLRRDLSHAKAVTEVWMNRARKAEAAPSANHSPIEKTGERQS